MSARDKFIASALKEHFGPHKPPDLTDSILARGASHERSRPRLPRRRWFAAATLLVGLGIVAAVPLLERPQDPVASQDPNGEGSYQPLSVGTRWEYVRSGPGGPIERVVDRATARIRVGQRDVYQILRLVGDQPEFFYIAVDGSGVWRYPGEGSGSIPGLRQGGEPVLAMAFPLEAGASWQSTMEVPVTGTAIAVSGGAYPSVRTTRRAIVVALDEQVTVPAGTFSTAHLRIEVTEGVDPSPSRIEHAWYASGVGLVKTTLETPSARNPALLSQNELTRFAAGSSPSSWAERLPTALAKHPELGDRGMPETVEGIDLGDVALILESEFAIARWGSEAVVLRIHEGRLSVFDRTDLEDWTRLYLEEPLCALSEGSLPQASTAALAELAGRLHAIDLGLVIGAFQVSSVMVQGTSIRQVQGTLAIAGGEALTCYVQVNGGRVVDLQVR